MILTNARVTHFRSIDDSGDVEIDPKVTALVGQNESGKTAFLQALHKSRSTEDGIGFDVTEDYPRKDLLDYETDHDETPATVVRLRYQLEQDEVESINAWLGHDLLETLDVEVLHDYGGNASVVLQLPDEAHATWIKANTPLSSDVAEAIAGAGTVDDLFERLETAELTESDRETVTGLEAKYPAPPAGWGRLGHAVWREHVEGRLPVFLYFDEYRVLPGRTYLAGLELRKVGGTLTDSDRGMLRLLDIAKLTPKQLIQPGGYEKSKARLEATGNKISRKVFGFWRQNPELKVQFDVDVDPDAEPPYNQGKNLYIRIENRRHEVTVPFDQRSKGFIWFFSFIAWFDSIKSEIEEDRRLILLLDEPGLSLHALAQADFLRYVEELSEDHQILYSTHSPFMVESTRLDRVRTVEDKRDAGTVVSGDVTGSNTETLFPLQAALGYSIAQNLFVSEKNLLVEGIADLVLLQTADEIVRASGRRGLREDVTVTPVGGVGKVSAFVSLFGANDLSIAVLHDYEGRDDQQIAHLVREKLLPRRGVLHYAQFRDEGGTAEPTDVEDLLEPETYLRYFNEAYRSQLPAPIGVVDLPSGARIVDRINRHLSGAEIQLRPSGGYNHYLPTKEFAASPPSSLSETELDRFARLFESVNRSFD